nr:hypothetical protein [Tanacetum cinerariifolium]
MEDTMLELVKICQEKEFLCIHDNVDDIIESALDSKLLLINPRSQLLEKKDQEVKNVVEQPAEHGNRKDDIEYDMPAKDVCSPVFTTFSNPLFKDNDYLDSSNEESLPDEDVPAEEFKIYSNPLCDEDEINSDKLDPHCFNVESDFVESLLNHDTFIDFSSEFDFSGELAHIKPEFPKSDFDFEEEIQIDIVTETDDELPSGIENFADDPEGDIRFMEELLIDDSILSHESFDSSFEDSPLIPRPPREPPDVKTDTGEEISVVMNDKDEDVYSSFILVIYPEMFSLLLSAESEDTIFDPGLSPGD